MTECLSRGQGYEETHGMVEGHGGALLIELVYQMLHGVQLCLQLRLHCRGRQVCQFLRQLFLHCLLYRFKLLRPLYLQQEDECLSCML